MNNSYANVDKRNSTGRFRLTISVNQIKFFILLLPFFELTYFSTFSMVDRIYSVAKILVLAYLLIYIFLIKKEIKFSAFQVVIVIYEIYLIVNTFLQSGALSTAITTATATIGFLLVVQTLVERNGYDLITSMMFIFELIIYGNLLVMLIFPQGLYGDVVNGRCYWLLGHQNQTILYVINAIMIAVIYMKMKQKTLRYSYSVRAICLIVGSVASIFYVNSATSIFGLFIILAVVLFNKFGFRITILQGVIVSLILFFVIVLFRNLELSSGIIQNILHRDLTLSGRTKIWDNALLYIKERPIFGYGIETYALANQRFGFTTAHCKYLYDLYQGGIVLFFLQLAIFWCVDRIDKKVKKQVPIILIACCCALLIQMTFESYTNTIFYLPFLLITEYDKLNPFFDKRHSRYKIIIKK